MLKGGIILPFYQQNIDASILQCKATFESVWNQNVQGFIDSINENTNISVIEESISRAEELYMKQAKGPKKEYVFHDCAKEKSHLIATIKNSLPALQQKALEYSNNLENIKQQIAVEKEKTVQFENQKRELETQKNLFKNLEVKMKQNENQLKADFERRERESEQKLTNLYTTKANEQAANFEQTMQSLRATHAQTINTYQVSNANYNQQIANMQNQIIQLQNRPAGLYFSIFF